MVTRLLFTCLLLPAAQLQAQDAPPPPHLVRDTAYALHNLFRECRFKAGQTVGYGTAGLVGTGFELAHGQTGISVGLGLISLVPTLFGFRKYWRYDTNREDHAVRQFENGWPLPPTLRRQLKGRHFKPLAVPP